MHIQVDERVFSSIADSSGCLGSALVADELDIADHADFSKLKLLLSNDVEQNPGPDRITFPSLDDWLEYLPEKRIDPETTDLRFCPKHLRSKLKLLLFDEDYLDMPTNKSYTMSDHLTYYPDLNAVQCEVLEIPALEGPSKKRKSTASVKVTKDVEPLNDQLLDDETNDDAGDGDPVDTNDNFDPETGLWKYKCESSHPAAARESDMLRRNIIKRDGWNDLTLSRQADGSLKGPNFYPDMPDNTCCCGSGWLKRDDDPDYSENGKLIPLGRVLTVYTQFAPVQCDVYKRVCYNPIDDSRCELAWNEGQNFEFNRQMYEMRSFAPEIRDLIAESMLNNNNILPDDIKLFLVHLTNESLNLPVYAPEDATFQFGTYNPEKLGRAYNFNEHGVKLRNVRKFQIDEDRAGRNNDHDDEAMDFERCRKIYSKIQQSAPGTSNFLSEQTPTLASSFAVENGQQVPPEVPPEIHHVFDFNV
ncbi:hypothetical protein MAR_033101 [Mya arenaria]|uniref:Uncharacterized protein n=1 Tax=Mya arenaria TaxID=6604 RepID=A0ABY7GAS2_MYAAR|nr:hypothetical protein MAR_033101 [Mya arenaria]